MDKEEIFRQILINTMNEGLLNEFISIVFNYNLQESDFVYAQFKVVDSNIILNIFDNNQQNRFNAYIIVKNIDNIYTEKTIDKNTTITYVYIDNCYKKYQNQEKMTNLEKVSATFKAKNLDEFKHIIQGVFPKRIQKIIYNQIKKEINLK